MSRHAHNIIELLIRRYGFWVSNFELMNSPELYGRRYGARIQELADAGIDIARKHGKNPEYFYKLITPPSQIDRSQPKVKLKPAEPQSDIFLQQPSIL